MTKALRTALEHITKIPTLSHGVLVKLSDVEAALETVDNPVAWVHKKTGLLRSNDKPKGADWECNDWQPLYTTTQQGHWCTYCGGINAHNCQFNTTIPRTQIYTTNHTGEIDGKTSPRR